MVLRNSVVKKPIADMISFLYSNYLWVNHVAFDELALGNLNHLISRSGALQEAYEPE